MNVYIASIYYYILNICSINYNIHTCIQYIAFALSWLKVDVLGCDMTGRYKRLVRERKNLGHAVN